MKECQLYRNIILLAALGGEIFSWQLGYNKGQNDYKDGARWRDAACYEFNGAIDGKCAEQQLRALGKEIK